MFYFQAKKKNFPEKKIELKSGIKKEKKKKKKKSNASVPKGLIQKSLKALSRKKEITKGPKANLKTTMPQSLTLKSNALVVGDRPSPSLSEQHLNDANPHRRTEIGRSLVTSSLPQP